MNRATRYGRLALRDPVRARAELKQALEEAGCFARVPALLGVSRRHLQRLVYMLDAWDIVEAHRARKKRGIMAAE